jgi:hypothetical protein
VKRKLTHRRAGQSASCSVGSGSLLVNDDVDPAPVHVEDEAINTDLLVFLWLKISSKPQRPKSTWLTETQICSISRGTVPTVAMALRNQQLPSLP